MILSYQYKLRPNISQSGKMSDWLNMLRAHYNWCLNDRIFHYEQRFIEGEYCELRSKKTVFPLTCSIAKNGAYGNPWKKDGTIRNAGLIQDAELPILKKARPWYGSIDSTVLQNNITRLNTAYKNFFEQSRGFPRFKKRSNFKSFEYKPRRVQINGNKIYLPKIGWCGFFNSRRIPDGFSIRSVTVRRKASGWFVSIRIEDKTVPNFPIEPIAEVNTVVGLDMGLTKLVHCSDGSQIDNPRFGTNKKTRRLLKLRQRRLSRTRKGSKNRRKLAIQIGKMHHQISERRNAYQWKVANKIVRKADGIAIEDLNIQGMVRRCKPKKCEDTGRFLANGQSAKSGLSRSIADASWGSLIQKIEYSAAKQGKVVFKVNPQHSSQTCSKCGCVDKANRDREKFVCTHCGYIAHSDIQAAQNIKAKAVKQYRIQLKKVRRDSPKPPKKEVQLTILGTPSVESTTPRKRGRKQHAQKSKRVVPGNRHIQNASDISDWCR